MNPAPSLAQFLTADHRRLDALLERALAASDGVDAEAYGAFRRGLLQHIAYEEKLVMPQVERTELSTPLIARLRSDHSTLAALLIVSPRPDILRTLREILIEHNRLEEGAGAMYELAEISLGSSAAEVLERITAMPAVKPSPHRDGPQIEAHLARALAKRS